MVAADNKMRCAMVFADDGMPDSLSWAAHTHSEREKSQDCHTVGIAGEESLVDTDTSEVVNIARFCQPDHWMNENICASCTGRAERKFTMGSMHGIPGLEGNDTGPTQLVEMKAKFGRRVSEGYIVVMVQTVDSFDFAPNVEILYSFEEVSYRGMFRVTTKHFLGFFLPARGQSLDAALDP